MAKLIRMFGKYDGLMYNGIKMKLSDRQSDEVAKAKKNDPTGIKLSQLLSDMEFITDYRKPDPSKSIETVTTPPQGYDPAKGSFVLTSLGKDGYAMMPGSSTPGSFQDILSNLKGKYNLESKSKPKEIAYLKAPNPLMIEDGDDDDKLPAFDSAASNSFGLPDRHVPIIESVEQVGYKKGTPEHLLDAFMTTTRNDKITPEKEREFRGYVKDLQYGEEGKPFRKIFTYLRWPDGKFVNDPKKGEPRGDKGTYDLRDVLLATRPIGHDKVLDLKENDPAFQMRKDTMKAFLDKDIEQGQGIGGAVWKPTWHPSQGIPEDWDGSDQFEYDGATFYYPWTSPINKTYYGDDYLEKLRKGSGVWENMKPIGNQGYHQYVVERERRKQREERDARIANGTASQEDIMYAEREKKIYDKYFIPGFRPMNIPKGSGIPDWHNNFRPAIYDNKLYRKGITYAHYDPTDGSGLWDIIPKIIPIIPSVIDIFKGKGITSKQETEDLVSSYVQGGNPLLIGLLSNLLLGGGYQDAAGFLDIIKTVLPIVPSIISLFKGGNLNNIHEQIGGMVGGNPALISALANWGFENIVKPGWEEKTKWRNGIKHSGNWEAERQALLAAAAAEGKGINQPTDPDQILYQGGEIKKKVVGFEQ